MGIWNQQTHHPGIPYLKGIAGIPYLTHIWNQQTQRSGLLHKQMFIVLIGIPCLEEIEGTFPDLPSEEQAMQNNLPCKNTSLPISICQEKRTNTSYRVMTKKLPPSGQKINFTKNRPREVDA